MKANIKPEIDITSIFSQPIYVAEYPARICQCNEFKMTPQRPINDNTLPYNFEKICCHCGGLVSRRMEADQNELMGYSGWDEENEDN